MLLTNQPTIHMYQSHWFLKASYKLTKEFRFENYKYETLRMELLHCFVNGYEKTINMKNPTSRILISNKQENQAQNQKCSRLIDDKSN